MQSQHTLGHTVALSSVGLHSGRQSRVSLSPAPVDHGIVFRRNTNGHTETCQASIRNVRPTELCTAIGSNGFQIQTTEHVLSALWGMGIDNAVIDIDAEEVPAMDGSAAAFAGAIRRAGVIIQERPRTYLKILKPIHIGDERRSVAIHPSPFPKITYTIDYDHPLIRQQTHAHEWSPATFQDHIARARTFAFAHEVKALWARGLAKGGSLDNAIVFTETGMMNEEALRFPDECVRHKILDLIGDMSLLGVHIVGHIIANRSGHALHNQLMQTILSRPNAWTLIGHSEKHETAPASLPPTGTEARHPVSLPAHSGF